MSGARADRHDPKYHVLLLRLPPPLSAQLRRHVEREGSRMTDVCRAALQEYLDKWEGD